MQMRVETRKVRVGKETERCVYLKAPNTEDERITRGK